MGIICQRTTSAVIHIFTQQGYTSDFYFDDVYGAEDLALAFTAFQDIQFFFVNNNNNNNNFNSNILVRFFRNYLQTISNL